MFDCFGPSKRFSILSRPIAPATRKAPGESGRPGSRSLNRLQDGRDGPRWPPRWLRWPRESPRWHKMLPRWPKVATRWAQDGPRGPPEASKAAQETSKRTSRKARRGTNVRFPLGFDCFSPHAPGGSGYIPFRVSPALLFLTLFLLRFARTHIRHAHAHWTSERTRTSPHLSSSSFLHSPTFNTCTART